MDDCIFCKIIRGKIPSKKVLEDDTLLAFEDIQPEAPVHILIIPKKHLAGISAATPQDEALLGRLLLAANQIAAAKGMEHFRVVVNNGKEAGQTVFHLHLHILSGRSMRWPPG